MAKEGLGKTFTALWKILGNINKQRHRPFSDLLSILKESLKKALFI
jgi:hypothetical protein